MLPDPIKRKDKYLSFLSGNTEIKLPEPITREDKYLYYLCTQGLNTENDKIEKVVSNAILRTASTNIVTGEKITISDSLEAPLAGLNIYGKSTQETTTGSQLINDSEIEIGGLSGANGAPFSTNNRIRTGSIPVTEGERYFLSGYSPYTIANSHIFNAEGERIAAFSINNAIPSGGVSVRFSFSANDSDLTNEDVKALKSTLMFNKGESALPYEYYTGGTSSPNSDYPQEITSVGDGGKINLSFHGANLLDIEKLKQVSNWIGNSGYRYFKLNLLPNTTYTLSLDQNNMYYNFNPVYNGRYACYIGNKPGNINGGTVIGNVNLPQAGVKNKFTFITTSDPYYLNLYTNNNWDSDNLKTVFEELLVNLQLSISDTALPYEPYQEQILEISTPNGLLGIPVGTGGNYTDSDNRQWICDEFDFKNKKFIERIGREKFSGSENEKWVLDVAAENKTRFYINLANGKIASGSKCLCNRLIYGTMGKSGSCFTSNSRFYIDVEASLNTVELLRTYLSAHTLDVIYQLETPIEINISDEEMQAFKELHTYKPNTTIMSGSEPQAGTKVEYALDMKTYVDNKFLELATQVLENA